MTDGDRRSQRPDAAEPQEEPPNQTDEHCVISLTGTRRFRAEPAWEAWFAESGQCFHRREDCRGLRNANRKQVKAICGACQWSTQQQRPYCQTTYLYRGPGGESSHRPEVWSCHRHNAGNPAVQGVWNSGLSTRPVFSELLEMSREECRSAKERTNQEVYNLKPLLCSKQSVRVTKNNSNSQRILQSSQKEVPPPTLMVLEPKPEAWPMHNTSQWTFI